MTTVENIAEDTQKYTHFIGVGGAGMSPLAAILLQRGCSVSGSDAKDSPACQRLAAAGARIFIGHRSDNITTAVGKVVVSTAIKPDNPEYRAAVAAGLPIRHRSQLLAEVMAGCRQPIAVAGAHGKTTTTAMIAWLLTALGADPGYMVGSEMANTGDSGRGGGGEWFVAEADESDGSFLNLPVRHAVLTNIEADHLDFYGSLADIERAFASFAAKLTDHGRLVYWGGDKRLQQLVAGCRGQKISFDIGGPAGLRADNLRCEAGHSLFDCRWQGERLPTISLQVPGRHNVLNGLAALATVLALGFPAGPAVAALAGYRGVRRRFETRYRDDRLWIVDDYAHHPTEIAAALQAATEVRPRRLICVFQPHRYTRTYHLLDEFARCFAAADLVVLTDVYPAGEAPIDGIDGRRLADEVARYGQPVIYEPDWRELPVRIAPLLAGGDLVMTIGAGNIYQVGEMLAASRAAGRG